MRSTPQRRAIFAAFRGGVSEHLSADEVYSRASVSLPDLGRGTVYATLAEFAEVGLLAALGTPEPVRYEINIERHAHFRCRLCGRLFNIADDAPDPLPFSRHGFEVERIELRAEGVCSDCLEFETGLVAGVDTMLSLGASELLHGQDAGAIELQTPLGPLLVAATTNGIARVAFRDHGDVEFLRTLVGREVSASITAHLGQAATQLEQYFESAASSVDCPIDWDVVGHHDELRATLDIPYGTIRSYHLLRASSTPRELGEAFGANPVPIFTPCHRVARGGVIPDDFVGGSDRREWMLQHEHRHPVLI